MSTPVTSFIAAKSPTTTNITPQKLPVNKNFPVQYVSVCIGQLDKDGKVVETVHHVDGSDVAIADYTMKVKQKHTKAKTKEGDVIGFEPTGEETLTLTVSYIRHP